MRFGEAGAIEEFSVGCVFARTLFAFKWRIRARLSATANATAVINIDENRISALYARCCIPYFDRFTCVCVCARGVPLARMFATACHHDSDSIFFMVYGYRQPTQWSKWPPWPFALSQHTLPSHMANV